MTVNDLIDLLYLYNGSDEITITEQKNNVSMWRPLTNRDLGEIKCGDKKIIRLAPNIQDKIDDSEPTEFCIG